MEGLDEWLPPRAGSPVARAQKPAYRSRRYTGKFVQNGRVVKRAPQKAEVLSCLRARVRGLCYERIRMLASRPKNGLK